MCLATLPGALISQMALKDRLNVLFLFIILHGIVLLSNKILRLYNVCFLPVPWSWSWLTFFLLLFLKTVLRTCGLHLLYSLDASDLHTAFICN